MISKELSDDRDHVLQALAQFAARVCIIKDLDVERKLEILEAVQQATTTLARATKKVFPNFPSANGSREAMCTYIVGAHEEAKGRLVS